MNLFQFPLIALRYRFSFSLVLPITLHMMQNIKILNISNFASGCACDGKESRMGKVQGPASRANARKTDGILCAGTQIQCSQDQLLGAKIKPEAAKLCS